MKLFTHNILSSQFLKNVKEGYPLILRAKTIEKKESEYDEEFVIKQLPKINYPVLVNAAKSIGIETDLPAELPKNAEKDKDLLKSIGEIMFVEVVEGELECPESGRRFPIKAGIPNMLINDDTE